MTGIAFNRFAAFANRILQVGEASAGVVCRPISKSAAGTNLRVVLLLVIRRAFGRRILGVAPLVGYVKADTAMRAAVRTAVKFEIFNIGVIFSVFTVVIRVATAICRRFTSADGNPSGLTFVL